VKSLANFRLLNRYKEQEKWKEVRIRTHAPSVLIAVDLFNSGISLPDTDLLIDSCTIQHRRVPDWLQWNTRMTLQSNDESAWRRRLPYIVDHSNTTEAAMWFDVIKPAFMNGEVPRTTPHRQQKRSVLRTGSGQSSRQADGNDAEGISTADTDQSKVQAKNKMVILVQSDVLLCYPLHLSNMLFHPDDAFIIAASAELYTIVRVHSSLR